MKTKTRILLEQFEIVEFLPQPVVVRSFHEDTNGNSSPVASPVPSGHPNAPVPDISRGRQTGANNRARASAIDLAARTRPNHAAIAHPPVFVLSPAGGSTFPADNEKESHGGG
jgi:hypothetical protein